MGLTAHLAIGVSGTVSDDPIQSRTVKLAKEGCWMEDIGQCGLFELKKFKAIELEL